MQQNIKILQYPIGKFERPKNVDKKLIEDWMKTIEEFPKSYAMKQKSV